MYPGFLNNRSEKSGNDGFSSIWLVCCLLALAVILLVFTELAAGYTASSEAEVITYTAGRSVLSEYQNDLNRRYLIRALTASDARLEKLSEFYISGSTPAVNGLVRLFPEDISVSVKKYSCVERKDLFRQQVKRVIPVITEYCMLFFGNRMKPHDGTSLRQEAEYIVTGGKSEDSIERKMRTELTLLREPINLVKVGKEPVYTSLLELDPGLGAVLIAAEATLRSLDDVDKLYAGARLSELGDYRDHLRLLLAAVPEKKKLQRMMDLMEKNIREIDKAEFSFSTYCYGFDISVSYGKWVPFTLGLWPPLRSQVFSQSHCYVR